MTSNFVEKMESMQRGVDH